MKIKFWGVRGSIGSPIRPENVKHKIEKILSLASPTDIQNEQSIHSFLNSLSFSSSSTYGGNTTCVEIRDKDGNLIIIDGGTGLRELGNQMMGSDFGKGTGHAYWILTHTHWDHIQGIPFFVPLFLPGNHFEFISCMNDIEKRLEHQFVFTHFPVSFDHYAANKTFQYLEEGETISLGPNIQAFSKAVRHPGGSFSYRFMEDGKAIIFASDAEFNLEEMENIDTYIDYFRDADVLVFDTQYTFEESLQKIDWGHSSASIATDIALRAKVKKLVMFHHDPSYDDEKLDLVYLRALKYKEMFDPHGKLEIIMAYEGLEIEV
ncbi:MBL fold metallo-hydrolase [Leptospira noumeaensis]|uniref:MBL fold metallo-hydrolase n=1 Tax=Leptospira noumeaensis TaxID=2484964 RepID=A0A4R9IFK5_9LEPT|nr:MBL fold metallo-hydrolase [Leptospira noumeaensis]TGK87053.1 MBL fold metallo-hydrolase [Leptospira noumeaensis]